MTEEKKDDVVEEATEETTEEAPVEETAEAKETTEEAPAVEEKKEEVKEDVKEEVKEETKEEEPEGADVEVPEKFKTLVEGIENMSVLDLHELVKLLEKKFGVSAAAVAVAGNGAGAGEEAEEGKSSFDVELSSAGDQKIAVIKAVKTALALGLKEAKDLVDSAPAILKKGVKKDEAEALKKEIEEAGGSVELK